MNHDDVDVKKALKSKFELLASVHADEHARYRIIGNGLVLVTLILPLFMLCFSLSSDAILVHFGVSEMDFKVYVAIMSLFVMAASILTIFLDPLGVSASHADAVRFYVRMKNAVVENGENDDRFINKISSVCSEHDSTPLIPNNRFVSLKRMYVLRELYKSQINDNPISFGEFKRSMSRKSIK